MKRPEEQQRKYRRSIPIFGFTSELRKKESEGHMRRWAPTGWEKETLQENGIFKSFLTLSNLNRPGVLDILKWWWFSYGPAVIVWLMLGFVGLVLKNFFPLFGIVCLLIFVGTPILLSKTMWANTGLRGRTLLLSSWAFSLFIIFYFVSSAKDSVEIKKARVSQLESIQEQKEFLAITIPELINKMEMFNLVKLKGFATLKGAGSGYDLYSSLVGGLGELYVYGSDGKIKKIELTLKQDFDENTNLDLIETGAQLASLFNLREWYLENIKSANWKKTDIVFRNVGGDAVLLHLIKENRSRNIKIEISKEVEAGSRVVESNEVKNDIESKLLEYKKIVEGRFDLAPLIKTVTVIDVSNVDKVGIFKVTVSLAKWNQHSKAEKIQIAQDISGVWSRLIRVNKKAEVRITIVDENDFVVGGTRENGKFFVQ